MKVLVLNCGSSSIKYKLYNMDDESVLAQGGVERIGLDNAFIKVTLPNGEKKQMAITGGFVGVQKNEVNLCVEVK